MTTNQSPAVAAAVAAALKVKTPRAPRRIPVGTDEAIRNLPTENKPYKNGTTRGEGLVIRVSDTGAKSFIFNYEGPDGRGKTHTIGLFGKYNYAQAVGIFDNLLEALANKEDIRAIQLEARSRALTTLQGEFDDWFPLYKDTVCEDYATRTKAVFDADELAPFRDKRLVAIETHHVLKFAKRAQVTRSGSYGREVVNLLDKLYEHARAEGRYKGDNPARGVTKKLKARDSQPWCALQLDQLATYYADVATIDASKRGQRVTQIALELLPHMTLRPTVLRVLKWAWIDWNHAAGPVAVVPAFEPGTKQRVTDKRDDKRGKNYAPYLVPLSRQVQALLRELETLTGPGTGPGVYLFPGSKSRKHPGPRPVCEGAWLQRLRAMGWNGETDARSAITVHGFRALFATWATERYSITPRDEHACEFQQDHKLTEGVRAHYTRDPKGSHRGLLLKERARVLQFFSDEIDTIRAANGAPLPMSRVDRAAALVDSQPGSNAVFAIGNRA